MLKEPKQKTVLSILQEIDTDGHSPLLVIADDFKKYLIKSTRDHRPSYYIINEFLCCYLLQIWKIPTPEFVSIKLDPVLLSSGTYSEFHKPHFYNNITFGSRWLEEGLEMAEYIRVHNKVGLRKFKNPLDIIKIGLFDIWVENTDRKPTNNNILFSASENHLIINAIDHAFTFDSVKYSDLNVNYINNTFNENILETSLAKDIISLKQKEPDKEVWIDDFKENFYLCINNCQQNFETVVRYIPAELGFDRDLSQFIRDFLFNDKRNKMVFSEFLSRIL
jgi:hypothetical protein